MQPISNNKPKAFSYRRVSIDRAIRILKRNGIQSDEEQAKVILDFFYLIAKSISKKEMQRIGI
ncbi:MAG TPA: hypothetical protein VN721_14530 [Flavipsychrobacter sp.]|nr:hypothetical protein [Flavipsychrobacter sp.]